MPEGQKVLIIDDDVDFTEANRLALEASGFRVTVANDSKTGAELAAQSPPDLVICDLMMEQLYSGFSVVQSLAAHHKTSAVPIIMVSAVTTSTGFRVDVDGKKPEWLNVVEFVNKPIDPVLLAAKVAAVLAAKA
ncbi:MAG TPA: response regulator [Armatimonadota bacterium]|nr:response regulator [Armatimonadota bacterium]HQK94024.1 response regulator [Armatimonadota bacterium]